MTRWKIEKESILLQSSNRTSILKMASFPAFIIVIFHIQPRWSLECLLKRLILKPQMEPLRITGTNTTECTNPISPESACKTLQETMSQTRVQVFFIPLPVRQRRSRERKRKKGMIALLTIHYHSPEALCIRSDGAREGGGGGGEGRGQGRETKRESWVLEGVCLLEGPR